MNYKQTLHYLYEQLPMFHRIGAAAYKADLNNTIAICKVLGNPEKKIRSVHVAGTNGKGSSSHMLAAIFQQAGYKTGLYTSPHLKDFRERIRINGKMIPKEKVTVFVKKHKTDFEKIKPSFFEWTVGLAFDHFAKEKVDIAIIEVGLGGRLDSTNVIQPLVSLITNIGYDHTALLGKTLPLIAKEKAGIIKKRTPVVISQAQREVKRVFIKKAKDSNSNIYFADQQFIPQYETYSPQQGLTTHFFLQGKKMRTIISDLPGTYQRYNIGGVLACVELLKKKFHLSDEHIENALRNTKKLTGLRGRWEVLNKYPRVICDTGHNTDGIRQVIESVNREYLFGTVKGRLHVVFGAVNDKDLNETFSLFKKDPHFSKAKYYFCKPAIPRGMELLVLLKDARKYGLKGEKYPSVKAALSAAKKQAGVQELVFAGGSTFIVAEIV